MAETRKSKEEIDELMAKAVVVGLEGTDFVSQFDYEQLSAYNGIGPSFLSEKKREKLSKYLALFTPAALIHDMRYEVGDGSRKSYNFANMEFRDNCYALASYAYGILNWRRYRAYLVAEMLYRGVCSLGGWVAWSEASRKNLIQQKEVQ